MSAATAAYSRLADASSAATSDSVGMLCRRAYSSSFGSAAIADSRGNCRDMSSRRLPSKPLTFSKKLEDRQRQNGWAGSRRVLKAASKYRQAER